MRRDAAGCVAFPGHAESALAVSDTIVGMEWKSSSSSSSLTVSQHSTSIWRTSVLARSST